MSAAHPLPSPESILGPIYHIGSGALPAPLAAARESALRVIEGLERIRSIDMGMEIDLVEGQALSDEPARVLLVTARAGSVWLDGIAPRVLERNLAILLPDLAPRYVQALEAARERVRDWQTMLAFALEEDDFLERQRMFVPSPPPPSHRPSRSKPLVLG